MRKRIISFVLVLTVLASMLVLPAAATAASEYQAVKNSVSSVIKGFAKQINRPNADDDAFNDFFVHGFFGNGKHMTLNDNSATTAAMFNSYVMQEALIVSITESIVLAQELQRDTMHTKGSVGWHNYYYNYGFTAYGDGSFEAPTRIKQLVNTKYTYGANHYQGATNENDSVMELLAGTTSVKYSLKETAVSKDKLVYTLDLTLEDSFDFDGDYQQIADKGYNTSTDDRLNDIGKLLTFFGIDEFLWDYHKTFQIEVPNNCDHTTSSYRWVHDSETQTLTTDSTNGFTANPGEHKTYTTTTTGDDGQKTESVRDYFELADTVVLKHNRPWVVEVEHKGGRSLQFGPCDNSTVYDKFYVYGSQYLWFFHYEYCTIPDEKSETGKKLVSDAHYVGVDIKGKFNFKSKYTYIYRFENVIEADGSNMVYASIYNIDLGELVFGPEPMDDHWIKRKGEKERVLLSASYEYLSGRDLLVNYIGSKSVSTLQKGQRELRIWENGKDVSGSSAMSSVVKAPTCTEQGASVYTCNDCGYSYTTDAVSALGHSYGDFVMDNNAGCTVDATQTRICTVCGEKDAVSVPNTATGHSYGEYVFDNNASCTTDGTQTRICTVCGEKDVVSVPNTAVGHDYKAVVTEPTYTEQGYTTYTCAVCGDSYKDDYTDVKQHVYEAVVTPPSCTEQGYTTYTCTGCGDSYVDDYTDIVEHTVVIDPAVEPTCVEKGKTEGNHCGVCGLVLKKQALISASNTHRMEETIVKMPTYDEPGQVAYICQDCGKTDYMEVPPLDKPSPTNPFTDVSESDWFYEPVLWAVENKVTGGKTETTFAPNEGCTRAQVVTFLWAANGKPAPMSMENKFTDVSENDWYCNAVLWAVEQGITTGIAATEFGPEQTCTRAQIATFLWAAEGKHAVTSGSEFVDVADGEWYATPIIWAKENDITGGIGNGMFGPNDTCTRAQVVTFLKKVYG